MESNPSYLTLRVSDTCRHRHLIKPLTLYASTGASISTPCRDDHSQLHGDRIGRFRDAGVFKLNRRSWPERQGDGRRTLGGRLTADHRSLSRFVRTCLDSRVQTVAQRRILSALQIVKLRCSDATSLKTESHRYNLFFKSARSAFQADRPIADLDRRKRMDDIATVVARSLCLKN